METVKKTENLKITLKSGKINSKTDLARKINLHSSEFYAICGRDDELDEIRICYDVYAVPGLEEIIPCPHSTDRSQCKFPMWIK